MSNLTTDMAGKAPRNPVVKLVATTLRNMGNVDWILIVFHCLLLTRVLFAPASDLATTALWGSVALLTGTILTMLLCRGELIPAGRFRAVAYRLLAISSVCVSYFEMGVLLPAMKAPLWDAELLWLDRVLFGETPAVVWAKYLSTATSTWFSFFYYTYLWLMGFNIIGSALLDPKLRRMGEILSGAAIVGVVGHLLYILVPGVGPYAHMTFEQPIPPNFWWNLVEAVVGNAGSMLDIFPSLHTAYPTFFALHAWRHRKTLPFNILWPISAFFALNMVISTMFLRWHYAVDVVAGLALSYGALRYGMWYMSTTMEREGGRQPGFEPGWWQS